MRDHAALLRTCFASIGYFCIRQPVDISMLIYCHHLIGLLFLLEELQQGICLNSQRRLVWIFARDFGVQSRIQGLGVWLSGYFGVPHMGTGVSSSQWMSTVPAMAKRLCHPGYTHKKRGETPVTKPLPLKKKPCPRSNKYSFEFLVYNYTILGGCYFHGKVVNPYQIAQIPGMSGSLLFVG